MCRYYVPCRHCAVPVLVDQPDNSKFPIREVACKDCLKMLLTDDTRLVGVHKEVSELLREHGFAPIYFCDFEITEVIE